MTPDNKGGARRAGTRAWYWLLLIPFVALLWVSSYAKSAPKLWGFPFFYWYQFMWVPLSAVIIGWVYWRER